MRGRVELGKGILLERQGSQVHGEFFLERQGVQGKINGRFLQNYTLYGGHFHAP